MNLPKSQKRILVENLEAWRSHVIDELKNQIENGKIEVGDLSVKDFDFGNGYDELEHHYFKITIIDSGLTLYLVDDDTIEHDPTEKLPTSREIEKAMHELLGPEKYKTYLKLQGETEMDTIYEGGRWKLLIDALKNL